MIRARTLAGFALFSVLMLVVSATAAEAQEGRCRGGPNNGQVCTTDADCPGQCIANIAHPVCVDNADCPNVCAGGDTPGATCADGLCPGACVGGDNAGAACLKFRDPVCTGGGRCSARCNRDQCQRAFCRFRGTADLLEDPAAEESSDTDEVACLTN